MNMSKILEFYNNTTPEEKKQFLNMMARDITIPYKKEDGIHESCFYERYSISIEHKRIY